MNKARYIKEITTKDPDTDGRVDLAIYKHENGGMFAMDVSFLEQHEIVDDNDNPIIQDPFNEKGYVILIDD